MVDDTDIRLYLGPRLSEVRRIRDEASLVEVELSRVLVGTGTLDPVRLDEWIDKRRTALGHIDVELMVLAASPIGSPRWLRWARWAWRWALRH